ncbi:MAG: asparagine synthase (glutamine-hydrolyzing) [Candidatus Eisenbacteria bacterium]|nr:asparagine synthase (glutamine-hydrolyzing) [Candidatus Eisenbacteria bacterium]
MCGIAGIYRRGGAPDERALRSMLARLHHRGPDDEGIFRGPGVLLGARRLSIIDIEGGHQPMAAGESVTVCQNGEIYNFLELRAELERAGEVFRTRSDTEVIGRLYRREGVAGLARLEGMFAAALFDGRTGELVLARDRSGIKPLYLVSGADGVAFASELSALVAAGLLAWEPDPEALRRFALFGFVTGAGSALRGAVRLEPGTACVFGAGGRRQVRFARAYSPFEASRPGAGAGPPGDPGRAGSVRTGSGHTDSGDLERELPTRLRAAVERHLRSDVPVGLFLSGGLDSGALAATLHELGVRAHAFTVGPPGGGHLDERPQAARLAAGFGMQHHDAALEAPDEAAMRELARAFDEPFADSSAYATLQVARLAREHVKVALSGTGGDETLSGYERYALPGLLRAVRFLPRGAAALLARGVGGLKPSRRSAAGEKLVRLGKLLSARAVSDPPAAYLGATAVAPGAWTPLFHGQESEAVAIGETLLRAAGLEDRPFDLAFGPACDHRLYLPDDLLVKEDRATMAVSLESRVPFLDVVWLAWTEAMGERVKRAGGTPKALMRRAMRGRLPDEALARPKHGFAMPVSEWLRAPAMRWVGPLLRGADGSLGTDSAAAARMFEAHVAGSTDAGGEIWALAMLELWSQEHRGAAGGTGGDA